MRLIVLALGFSVGIASAFAVKPCDELKSEIAAKLDAKGVKNYELGIVPAAEVKQENVVGSCEGGTKKITYKKSDTDPDHKAKPPAAPQGR